MMMLPSRCRSTAFVSSVPAHAGCFKIGKQVCGLRSRVDTRRCRRLVGAKVGPVEMLSAEVIRTAIAVYGTTITVGGVGAFVRSKSKMSLISAIGSGVLLGVAYGKNSIGLALGVAIALAGVFGVRLVKTGKVMPAGALCVLSVVFAVVFGIGLNGGA